MLKKVDYVMAMVADMNRSVAFYRDKLGLEVKMESPGWTEFATGDTTLALHGGGEPATAPPSEKPKAGTCTFGFSVDDLDGKVSELKGKGVRFVMEPTDRPEEGIRLAVCIDPDGLAISFAQMLQHAHKH